MKERLLKKAIVSFIRLVTLLVTVCIISFVLVDLSPIDPVQAYVGVGVSLSPEQRENIEKYWGLGEPPVTRFITWAEKVIKGDLGISTIYRRPVSAIIKERFVPSVSLMIVAWLLSGIVGFALGVIMGMKRDQAIDKIIKTICLTLSSTPSFWIGLLFLMIFSIWLKWFPIGLSVPAGKLNAEVTVIDRIYHMILPALTLSFTSFASVALHTREKLITVLESDYILFARARGEKDIDIIKHHALRNIIIPAIILQFSSFSELFGGSILVEQVFSYPGLGQAAVQAGMKGDVPLLLGITIFSTLFVFTGNYMANMIHQLTDPKQREGRSHE